MLGSSPSPAAAQNPADLFYLPIRYRTQLDGTAYQSGNCGPSTLGMIVSAFRDEYIKTTDLREQANVMQGTFGVYDSGTSFEVLTAIGRRYGVLPLNLYDTGGGYHQWTLDEVRTYLRAGSPVMPQTNLRRMPGHATANPAVDHFFVLIGTSGDNFIYHDPALPGTSGQSLVITPEQLLYAWQVGTFGLAAVAFKPDETLLPLLPTATPLPATPTPVPPSPTSTPQPSATATATAVPTLTPTTTAEAAVSSLLAQLFGQVTGPSSDATPSPTPDNSAWQIGGGRTERAGPLSSRGESRSITVDEPTAGRVASADSPLSLPAPAVVVFLLPLAHLVRRWLAERGIQPPGRRPGRQSPRLPGQRDQSTPESSGQ